MLSPGRPLSPTILSHILLADNPPGAPLLTTTRSCLLVGLSRRVPGLRQAKARPECAGGPGAETPVTEGTRGGSARVPAQTRRVKGGAGTSTSPTAQIHTWSEPASPPRVAPPGDSELQRRVDPTPVWAWQSAQLGAGESRGSRVGTRRKSPGAQGELWTRLA